MFARHLVGMATAWLVVLAETVAGYLGLLSYALVTDADPGGPLAGPLLVLIAAVLGLVLLPLLFLPAVAVAEAAGRRRGVVATSALAGAAAIVLAVGYAVAASVATDVPAARIPVATDVPAARIPVVAGFAALAVLPPTVAYALAARGVGRLRSRLGWARRAVAR
ncbi:hypothetical protein GA0070622_2581 [Micromonospora sediminicola]|uniref:Uncharacterized protein n=1 Tax=Micromonospora sediminicola TaxID=946078 RepID=A0A1A9B8W7_9ACTN|nr:hypothetical protein [Micromonospora sediminicola]SBT65583.1 hypothetical protein GA0070622_2581 [Micromonospora sediminicola]